MTIQVQIIGVAGGSGSGKTTFARLLQERLGDSVCAILGQDHYYIDQSAHFRGDGENVNFDHPNSLDFPLMAEHLKALKNGKAVEVPIYDFATHKRLTETNRLEPKPVILVDGILILSQTIVRGHFDHSLFIDAPEEVRFARRLKRDTVERGRQPEGVRKQFERQVKPMHDQFVEPSKNHAQLVLSGTESFSIHLDDWCQRLTGRSKA